MNDLIAGHVQMFFDLMPVVLPQVAAGKEIGRAHV